MTGRTRGDPRRCENGAVPTTEQTPVSAPDAPDADADGGDEARADDGDPTSGGLSRGRAIALALAFLWLGGAFGWSIAQRSDGVDPGSVDAGFYLDMIAHHDQAVEMALIELGGGEDPTVLDFAQEVIVFQRYEIGRMDEALRDWGVGREDRGETAMAWMGMAVPAASMPGLASDDEMQALRDAEGAAADALFLELMAEHHRGGIHMADYAAANASDPGVQALAARMARNQAIEVNEYARTADRLGFDVDIEPVVVGEGPGG